MLSPSTIAESLCRLHQKQNKDIGAFWIEWADSRKQLGTELQSLTKDLPILVTAVASGRFMDPNGVIDDLSLIISEHEDWFTPEKRRLVIRDQKFSIVLISKRPLGVPQISSPVSLPDWFPVWPGKVLTTHITSILHSISISLSSQDIPLARINCALYALEQSLCTRFDAVFQTSPTARQSFMSFVARGASKPINLDALIASSRQGLQSRNASEFRPGGAGDSDFVVSHFARTWRDCHPKDRQQLAKDAADALGLTEASLIESLFSFTALLSRGKEKLSAVPNHITFSRSLMVTISDAVQFINGIHHADEFPQFPALLTIAFAAELVNLCHKAADTLNKLR